MQLKWGENQNTYPGVSSPGINENRNFRSAQLRLAGAFGFAHTVSSMRSTRLKYSPIFCRPFAVLGKSAAKISQPVRFSDRKTGFLDGTDASTSDILHGNYPVGRNCNSPSGNLPLQRTSSLSIIHYPFSNCKTFFILPPRFFPFFKRIYNLFTTWRHLSAVAVRFSPYLRQTS